MVVEATVFEPGATVDIELSQRKQRGLEIGEYAHGRTIANIRSLGDEFASRALIEQRRGQRRGVYHHQFLYTPCEGDVKQPKTVRQRFEVGWFDHDGRVKLESLGKRGVDQRYARFEGGAAAGIAGIDASPVQRREQIFLMRSASNNSDRRCLFAEFADGAGDLSDYFGCSHLTKLRASAATTNRRRWRDLWRGNR